MTEQTSSEVLWKPQPGPQDLFLRASQFEVLYGGAAGGGKTEALIHDGVRAMDHPRGSALFLRASFPELSEVMERAQYEFPKLNAVWRASEKYWRFPSGAKFAFGYCETFAEAVQYMGKEFTWIGFDEIGNLKEEKAWSMLLTRIRSKEAGIKVYARASANPGGAGHGWLKKRFVDSTLNGTKPYRDPLTGLTRHYIPSRVTDNKILLDNNPLYMAQLQSLPDRMRRQLLDGDWNAGAGLAFDELHEIHFKPTDFAIPDHWTRIAGLDWGFNHPWWYEQAAVDPEGNLYVYKAVHGRRQLPDDIISSINDTIGNDRPSIVAGGLDLWHQIKSRGEQGPTLAERMQQRGLPLVRATVSRVSGYQNLLQYLAWRNKASKLPKLFFVDNPGTRALYEQLAVLTIDEDNPEDVLKVDADTDTGQGGDDGYDCLRYLAMTRPYTMPLVVKKTIVDDLISRDRSLDVPSEESQYDGGQYLGE